MRSIFQNWKNDPQYSRQLLQETVILDVTEDLVIEMQSLGVDRVTLAMRLGKSKAFVSQILGGSRNMTLRTLADFCWALGLKPKITYERAAREQFFAYSVPGPHPVGVRELASQGKFTGQLEMPLIRLAA